MMKRSLSLLLVLIMMLSMSVITVSAATKTIDGTGSLAEDEATLNIGTDKTTVASGGTDTYVQFSITITTGADNTHGMPAFSFKLKPSTPSNLVFATQQKKNGVVLDDPNLYYVLDPNSSTGTGKITVSEFKYTPGTMYFAAGGLNGSSGIASNSNLLVMNIIAKVPANTAPGSYGLDIYTDEFTGSDAKYNFVAGIANGDQFIRKSYGTSFTVVAGKSVSGTLKDASDTNLTGITSGTVSLYKDGVEVASTTDVTDGTYSFSNVSTGTYTVKAKVMAGGKTLGGNTEVKVETSDLTDQDITVREGSNVSGTVVSHRAGANAQVFLFAENGLTDLQIRQGLKAGTIAEEDAIAVAQMGANVTANSDGKRKDQTYSFDTIEDGTYRLVVYKPDHATYIETITIDSADILNKEISIYLLGDANKSGNVDIGDSQRIYEHVTDLAKPLAEEDWYIADANLTGGNPDIGDAERVYEHVTEKNLLFAVD